MVVVVVVVVVVVGAGLQQTPICPFPFTRQLYLYLKRAIFKKMAVRLVLKLRLTYSGVGAG